MGGNMRRKLAPALGLALCLAVFAGCAACSKTDKEKADERAERAKEKSRDEAHRLGQDAHKLGQEARADAKSLGRKIDQALNSTGRASSGPSESASEKLRRGTADLRVEGEKAGVKLDRAAMVAKVKAKLASDVGLSTITNV